MIDPETAWATILDHADPLASSQEPLLDCFGCVLARPVCADRDIPAADRAAMDGFAVRAEDIRDAPATLRVVGEVPAGSGDVLPLSEGECVRIYTGAVVPADADTVVMVEDTESASTNADAATFLRVPDKGQHIFRQGENARKDEVLLPAGTILNASRISICASVGCSLPEVYGRPRVGVLTTGAELKQTEDAVERYEIRDSNGPMLEAALGTHAFTLSARLTAPDEEDPLVACLQQLLEQSDVVLITGGVSVGKYDLVPTVIARAGGTVLYHGVAMKPGKPQLFATAPDGTCVFGLPGNPLSVMTGFHEFVLPALHRLSGRPPETCRQILRLPLAAPVSGKGKRQHLILGRLVSVDGHMTAIAPVANTGSADLVAGGKAIGMILVPEGAATLDAGTIVDVRIWEDAL